MPRGIFFLIHNEIRGPEIKCSYFTSPITLPQEFISKLYMSHASFESSHLIEIKFDHYKSVSCYTGSLDRRTQKEGILGIIFEENEEFKNLDLFLLRNLEYTSNNQDDKSMEEIFDSRLLSYLELLKILKTVEVEDIPEILIMTGDSEYRSCFLRLGDENIMNTELKEIYQKILEKQSITQYYYSKLKVEKLNNIYLTFKTNKSNQNFEKIISTINPYLERFFYYSLEILTLFLFPSVVRIVPYTTKLSKKYVNKNESVLRYLQNSENYSQEFTDLISYLSKGEVYLSSDLKN